MTHSYPGSRWWKFDFHNHTPASLDYRGDKAITPCQWLQDYLDKGIQCIVVTDHNTGGWIDKLKAELAMLQQQDTATWGGMTIFPGMELSCSGGVHLMVILDPTKGTSDIDAIRGSVGYTGTPGDSDAVTSQSVEQVIRAIQSAGGVACAAHVDQPKGLLTSLTDHNTLRPIFKLLDAIEIIDPTASCLQPHSAAVANLASVLGSDSHQPSEIGRGYTWVKMSAPSIEGLKLALLDPESAIRRSDECTNYPQQLNHPKIKSITVEKLRLRQKDPLTIHFNPSYNALIGGRGSGKSTILECLRLGLARENELLTGRSDGALKQSFENFKKEKTGRNQPGMMLHDSRITVEVSKGQGDLEERFEYRWMKGVDAKFAVSVRRWDSGAWQATQLTEEQARSNFPVKMFSQKQILALADNPQHLIQYIDDVLGGSKAAWEKGFSTKSEALSEARKRVRTLEAEIAQKPAVELQYKEASRKAKVFASSNFGVALKAYQRAGKQQRSVQEFFKQLGEDVQSLQTSAAEAASLKNLELTDFEATTPAEQAEKLVTEALTQKLAGNFDQITALVASMQADLAAAQAASDASAWHQENKVHLDEYARIVAELKAQGITNAEDASQAVALEEKLKKQLDQFNVISTDLEQARKTVVDSQAALHQERQELTVLRQNFLNQVLIAVPALKITLNSMADAEAGANRLREVLRIDGETFVKEIFGETDTDPPKPCGMVWDLVNPNSASSVSERLQEIKQSLEEMNEQVLNTKLNGKFVKKLKEMKPELASVVFDELAAWFPEDAVDLQYKRDESSSFQSLQQASAGQKTAAILSFLLAHGSEPLLMDQPEDDLDNALVSQLVVAQLRNNKNRRQLIVITHNANIVVNGDAELVMPMEFVGGQIVNNTAGGLQERSVRKKVCEIMEGGEKAFEQRYKRILKDMERTA